MVFTILNALGHIWDPTRSNIPYLHDSHCWIMVQSTLWFKGYRHWDAAR